MNTRVMWWQAASVRSPQGLLAAAESLRWRCPLTSIMGLAYVHCNKPDSSNALSDNSRCGKMRSFLAVKSCQTVRKTSPPSSVHTSNYVSTRTPPWPRAHNTQHTCDGHAHLCGAGSASAQYFLAICRSCYLQIAGSPQGFLYQGDRDKLVQPFCRTDSARCLQAFQASAGPRHY